LIYLIKTEGKKLIAEPAVEEGLANPLEIGVKA